MVAVPHACFSATFPGDEEFSHPPGAFLARKLEVCLRGVADTVGPFDKWRGRGWVVGASMNSHRFEVYFAPFDGNQWLLAISPVGQPGLFGRLLGRNDIDVSAELGRFADSMRHLLSESLSVSGLFRQFGGPPNLKLGVPSPEGLQWIDAP
jgi:hypothetical protein